MIVLRNHACNARLCVLTYIYCWKLIIEIRAFNFIHLNNSLVKNRIYKITSTSYVADISDTVHKNIFIAKTLQW